LCQQRTLALRDCAGLFANGIIRKVGHTPMGA
jgi:hypothetical protein